MYALVLLKKGPTPVTEVLRKQHEKFIDELIGRNGILLGGEWLPPAEPFAAAYLLRCDSLGEARSTSSLDPYVRERVYSTEVVKWDLVGINPNAIDPGSILTSDESDRSL